MDDETTPDETADESVADTPDETTADDSTEGVIAAGESAIIASYVGQIAALKATVASLTAALTQAQADMSDLLEDTPTNELDPEPDIDDEGDDDELEAVFAN